MLTEDQKQKYLKAPVRCPNCGSDNLAVDDDFCHDPKFLFKLIFCDNCGAGWKEVFKLHDINDYVKPGESCLQK